MKDKGTAYLWWLLGLHRFYLGKPKTALLQFITLGGLGIWWMIDFFTIPSMVKEYNEEELKSK